MEHVVPSRNNEYCHLAQKFKFTAVIGVSHVCISWWWWGGGGGEGVGTPKFSRYIDRADLFWI